MSSEIVKQNLVFGLIISFFTAIIMGIYPPASRAVYIDGGNVTFMLFFITFARTLTMVGYCLATKKKIFNDLTDRKRIFWGGFAQAVSVACIMGALAYLPGPVVLIIIFSYALFLLFYQRFRGEVKLDAVSIISALIALLGLTFVLDVWNKPTTGHLIGFLLAFTATAMTVWRFYIFESQMKTRNPAVIGAESFTVATLCILPLAIFYPPIMPETLAGWGWGSLAAITMGIGTLGMFYGIAHIGGFRWGLFGKLEPIFTAFFSVWFLGEYLKPSQYLGMGVVLVSLVTYQVLSNRKAKRLAELKASLESGA